MTSYQLPNTYTASALTPLSGQSDWHVLVLFADDTEASLRGLWGPYSTFDVAAQAMEELRQWPIEGYWDIRRLNKFVALKLNGEKSTPAQWTWQHTTGNA